MLNNVVLIGRLTRDPDRRFTTNGTAVTTFTLAVDRGGKDKGADFVDIQAWKGTAEMCAQYLAKGKMAAVQGRLEISTFEGQDGEKRKVTRVIASNVQFLSPKEESAKPKVVGHDKLLGDELEF
jgi:single-strand DNA-binding protein